MFSCIITTDGEEYFREEVEKEAEKKYELLKYKLSPSM